MKEECLICRAPLIYFEKERAVECAICHKRERSSVVCKYFNRNNQCIGTRYPFFPKNQTKTTYRLTL
jgi:LSD1 subclass zinc finger protein